MRAEVGDHLIVQGHRVGDKPREAAILEVHGANGAPPYLIRWLDDGHEGVFFPGSDVTVEHLQDAQPSSPVTARGT